MTKNQAHYITIDLDRPARVRILQAWYNLSRIGPATIQGRISSSGEGVHIAARLHEPITYEAMMEIRRELGDDPRRIYFDEVRPEAKPSQILFDIKRGRAAGEWTTDIEHLQRMYRP